MKKFLMLTAIGSLCFAVSTAEASEYYKDRNNNNMPADHIEEPESEWKVSIGALGTYGDYDAKGIDSNKWQGWPVVNVDYYNWTLSTLEGIQYKIVNTDNWLLKAGVKYDPGRRNSQLAKSRKGLGEIDEGAMAIASVQYTFLDDFSVGLEGSKSSADGDGTLVSANFRYETPIFMDNLKMGLKAETTWADSKYMDEYFGVNSVQAANTGFTAFSTSSGMKHTSLSIDFTYSFMDNWDWNVMGGANFLHEDAKDSPVAKSEVLPYAMTSLVYKF